MSKNTFAAATLAIFLAACSSTSLDQAPVGDRSAANSPGQGGAGESRVAPVTAQQRAGDALGPIGASRLVYFDYDSYAIRPEFRQLLDSHAKYLRDNRTRKVVLEGHTDERGGREYNLALGQQRSEAVRRALALLGVPASQVEAVSFGKEKPAAAGGDEAAWAKNRRAEMAYR
jgi:peptidoglycan-associated lipoprotein